MSDRVNVAYCIQGLAVAASSRDETRRAALLLGAAEGLLKAAAAPLYAWADHELHQRAADDIRERLGEQAWTRARGEGRAMALEQAVEYALQDATASSE